MVLIDNPLPGERFDTVFDVMYHKTPFSALEIVCRL